MSLLKSLLLLSCVLLCCSCVAPNRSDYSPDDEVDDGVDEPPVGDDDDQPPPPGSDDDDDDQGPTPGNDDDGAADCATVDAIWTACAEVTGEEVAQDLWCSLEDPAFTIDWDCMVETLDGWDCAGGLPGVETFADCIVPATE